ncbi:unnamed protein product [Rotaria magnacalcarata]|uniref:Uncharacterized protein n=1 Tax=Rotaria magnacalcarata TaxID=392030 RepID=A0A816VHH6_9BILA|nr:unnamed protein product [Rotaria magnacalcarata]
MMSIIHEPLYRNLFDHDEEKCAWCVLRYSEFIEAYSSGILLFHNLAPLLANLFSAGYIIFQEALLRAQVVNCLTYNQLLRLQLKEHKQIVISPLVLLVLSLPRVIISFLSECVKASRNLWRCLSNYFISFIPFAAIFVVFVLSSKFYKGLFKGSLKRWRKSVGLI